jgi:methionyl-tRNA formyltransferase
MKKNVVILCPSAFSAYSISVINLLLENQVTIQHILIQPVFSRKRIIKEFRKNGIALVSKFFKKIILQKIVPFGIVNNGIDGFTKFFIDKKYVDKSILEICKKNDISYSLTNNFHDIKNIEYISRIKADLIIFTGGGIIRKSLLEISKFGVINCHMGILPYYRGMDSTNWAFLHNDSKNVGCTTHIMDNGIDTGPILAKYFVEFPTNKLPDEIDSSIEYIMANSIVDSIIGLLDGKIEPKPQESSDGRQFFSMDLKLKLFLKK